jgi:hypothetical protein
MSDGIAPDSPNQRRNTSLTCSAVIALRYLIRSRSSERVRQQGRQRQRAGRVLYGAHQVRQDLVTGGRAFPRMSTGTGARRRLSGPVPQRRSGGDHRPTSVERITLSGGEVRDNARRAAVLDGSSRPSRSSVEARRSGQSGRPDLLAPGSLAVRICRIECVVGTHAYALNGILTLVLIHGS